MTTIPKRVYVAGPMRGIAEFNFPAFDTVTAWLRRRLYTAWSPAEHDRENGFDPAGLTGNEDLAELGFSLRDALATDLEYITQQADGIALLPGWRQSSGARAEVATAAALGLLATEIDAITTVGSNLIWDEVWRPAAELLDGRLDGRARIGFASGGLVTGGTTVARNWFARDAVQTVGEIRVTNPVTGGEKGSKEVRMDLVPVFPLTELARLFGRGAQKYADRNWERGYDWSLSYAAALRHLTQWWGGEDTDPEMGTSHLASVAWHAFALLQFTVEHPELDDRPAKPAKRAAADDTRRTSE